MGQISMGEGSPKSASAYYGRQIVAAKLDDNKLYLSFDDGVTVVMYDNGQNCCETRYVHTDDDVAVLVGHPLTRIEVKEGPDVPDKCGVHETCFLDVATDQDVITLVTHNEHNGYYSGFELCIDEASDETTDA